MINTKAFAGTSISTRRSGANTSTLEVAADERRRVLHHARRGTAARL